MDIYLGIDSIKGIGPKSKEKLNKVGIFTVLDLLLYFPRDYEFVNGNEDFKEIDESERKILTCVFKRFKGNIQTKNRKTITTLEFEYNGHIIEGKWFNQVYIKSKFKFNEKYNLLGKFKSIGNKLEVVNPIVSSNHSLKSEIIPKYALRGDLTNNFLVKIIGDILDNIEIKETFPKEIMEKYKFISLDKAIREIHYPKTKNGLEMAITRLKFQELFTYSMKLLLLKDSIKKEVGIQYKWTEKLKELKDTLPFPLTEAQTKVVRNILRDQNSTYPMNRLVQGDVGSGKTIVALIGLFNAYINGYKGVLMAPTEILATQHYEEASKIYKDFDIDVELLTGSTKEKEKRRIKERAKEEKPLILIGTHALIQDDVEINNLGLVVTDEQHRFGVEQRARIVGKGKKADVLVMTATPIPRTLALYVYSDLDVSVIDELPPGRKKVDTRFYEQNNREAGYNLARSEVDKGRQVYIVCPLIEENEKLELNSVEKIYEELKYGVFRGVEIEFLHGKMKPKEKDEIIGRFKDGETKVIISTTVIEVGVNVPNATVMIVENAERFGLAQLHQLRGRVGRGSHESYCILIAKAKSDKTKKRMEILVESTDGFYISEQDLKIRGSGEMFGRRQSGDESFILANIYDDMKLLIKARSEAEIVVKNNDYSRLIEETEKNIENTGRYICFN
ncbi:MAG: ATP-dependent DNA helicase RecG [Clostridium sp.]|uniref:ATP-dependent DNA helicase RecG n=1 Tax=Clostridium sp. TaxID=1506 RepID=UPI003EE7DD99